MASLICVLNKKSRDGLILDQWARVSDLLDARQIGHDVIDLTEGDFTAALSTAIASRPDLRAVAGLGGDGTHMSVLNALQTISGGQVDASPPFAICPFGTGNDVAKSLGLRVGQRYLPETVDTMLDGRIVPYDLGTWNNMVFADALCVGLDAEILRARDQLVADMKARPQLNRLLRGYPLYLIAAARIGLRPPRWQVRIEADGQPWYDGPMTNLVINNCRIHAGEFDVTPDARPNDGLLDAVLIPHLPMNLYRYAVGFRHLPDALKRSAPVHWLRPLRHQARHFSIQLTTPSPIQVDGEYFQPTDHLEVGIRPAAARISIPTRCPWAA